MHSRESDETSRLPDERRIGPQGGEPGVFESGVLHLADDVDAPILRLRGLIAEALERNPDLHFVTPVSHAPARLKDVVGAQVGLLAPDDRPPDESAGRDVRAFHDRAVALYAKRIDREHQRLLAIVKRAEQDLDVVVAEDLIAVGEGGGRPPMELVGADPEVDRVGRVPHEHLGRVGRGHPVIGGVLREAGQHRGARPDRVGEVAVDYGVGFEAGNSDAQLSLAPRVDSQGVRASAGEQQAKGQQHDR